MSEGNPDFSELRREVIEARNQSIKTDNQIKNLSLDVKGFENRFDILERRLRFSQVGVHLVVAVTIAVAAYFVSAARTRSLESELAQATQDANKVQQAAATKSKELDGRLQQIEDEKRNKKEAQQAVVQLLTHLDKKEIDKAIALLDKADLNRLSELERRLAQERVNQFRKSVGEKAYHTARDLLARGRRTDAIKALGQSVKVSPKGRYSDSARYLLGISLREAKRYKEAVQVFDTTRGIEKDKRVLEEIKYWQGYSLAKLGKNNEAKQIFEALAKEGGRHSSAARSQLADLATAIP